MSTEPKWTPGPWSIGKRGDGAIGSVYCDNALGSRVAIVFGEGQEFSVFSRREEEANAHLIAAAPELYEALKRIDTAMNAFIWSDATNWHVVRGDGQLTQMFGPFASPGKASRALRIERDHASAQASAALSKARGES